MKVAAYQAPLHCTVSPGILERIRTQVDACESEGVTILCCPEAVLGGLADYHSDPQSIAIGVHNGELERMLAPLASDVVTTIVGFSERTQDGKLHNAAAVFHRGRVAGIYRKLHPAINRSVYERGGETPVFRIEDLTFGIVICNDSNFRELPKQMAALGATALFVPANNGLPKTRPWPDLVTEARRVDIARALENSMWVVRADVAGSTGEMASHGCSTIVDPSGTVITSAARGLEDLIIANIEAGARVPGR